MRVVLSFLSHLSMKASGLLVIFGLLFVTACAHHPRRKAPEAADVAGSSGLVKETVAYKGSMSRRSTPPKDEGDDKSPKKEEGSDGNGNQPPAGPTNEGPTPGATAPQGLSYPNAEVTGQVGQALAPIKPTLMSGAADRYEIDPALPDGLTFDTASGEIAGTPQAPIAQQTFTVRASNALGEISTELKITISEAAPPAAAIPQGTPTLTYGEDGTVNLVVGTPATVQPTMTGTLTGFSIRGEGQSDPNTQLGDVGLTFNTSSGNIAGRPTKAQSFSFTVIGSSASGQVESKVTLNIAEAPKPQADQGGGKAGGSADGGKKRTSQRSTRGEVPPAEKTETSGSVKAEEPSSTNAVESPYPGPYALGIKPPTGALGAGDPLGISLGTATSVEGYQRTVGPSNQGLNSDAENPTKHFELMVNTVIKKSGNVMVVATLKGALAKDKQAKVIYAVGNTEIGGSAKGQVVVNYRWSNPAPNRDYVFKYDPDKSDLDSDLDKLLVMMNEAAPSIVSNRVSIRDTSGKEFEALTKEQTSEKIQLARTAPWGDFQNQYVRFIKGGLSLNPKTYSFNVENVFEKKCEDGEMNLSNVTPQDSSAAERFWKACTESSKRWHFEWISRDTKDFRTTEGHTLRVVVRVTNEKLPQVVCVDE